MGTDYRALDALYPLPPETLLRQWRLTDRDLPPLAGWARRTLGAWHLDCHPDTDVWEVRSGGGMLLGWILEPLLALAPDGGSQMTGPFVLPVEDPDEGDIEKAFFGREVGGTDGADGSGVLGRWTAILLGANGAGSAPRICLGAPHSILFDSAARVAAPSASLFPGRDRDLLLSELVDPLATARHYAFDQTAFINIRRLLPNFFLNLTDFSVARHWPTQWPMAPIAPDEAARRLGAQAARVQEVLSEAFSTFRVPLSAGRDSRAVLSLLRPATQKMAPKIELFTSHGTDAESRIDADIAAALAAIAGLDHTVRQRKPMPPGDPRFAEAFVRIGEARAGTVLRSALRSRPSAEGVIQFPGMGGEAARAFWWHGNVPTQEHLSPAHLTRRVNLPPEGIVTDAAARWRDSLPPGMLDEPQDVYDLMFIEVRLGCWEAPVTYLWPPGGNRSFNFLATPLALELQLRLPARTRLEGSFQTTIIDTCWPELNALPFNKPRSARLKLDILKDKAMALPGRARNKIALEWALRRKAS